MNLFQPIQIAVILIAGGWVCGAELAAQTTAERTLGMMVSQGDRRSVGELIRGQFSEVVLARGQSELGDDEPLEWQERLPQPAESPLLESPMEDTPAQDHASDRWDWETDDPFADNGLSGGQDDHEADRRRDDSIGNRITELQKPVTQIAIRATTDGVVPVDRAAEVSTDLPVIAITAMGIGPIEPDRYTVCFRHRPLYYEQKNLERCGNGFGCWQNAISGGQFLCNTLLLPYHLGQQPCNGTVPAGGDCKCGQSYSATCDLCPPSVLGLTKQAAAVAGFSFLLL